MFYIVDSIASKMVLVGEQEVKNHVVVSVNPVAVFAGTIAECARHGTDTVLECGV